jgi:hypothetical protein
LFVESRVYGLRNRRHTAHERGPGSPRRGHLIVLCEETFGGFASSPGSVVRPSAVHTSDRHSTWRKSRQRSLIARSTLSVKSPVIASSIRMRSWIRLVQTVYVLAISIVHSELARNSQREEIHLPTAWGQGPPRFGEYYREADSCCDLIPLDCSPHHFSEAAVLPDKL